MKQKWYKWIAIALFLIVGVWLGVRMNNYHEITLYFPDSNAEWLVAETRRVETVPEELKPDQLVEELINGPTEEGLVSAIPEGTVLLPLDSDIPKILVENGIAKVNLSEEFKSNHPGGSAAETMTLGSIVNTLTELEGIDKVQLYINGHIVESLNGHWGINEPLARMPELIKP